MHCEEGCGIPCECLCDKCMDCKANDLRDGQVFGHMLYSGLSKRKFSFEVAVWNHSLPLFRRWYPHTTLDEFLDKFFIFKPSLDIYFEQKKDHVKLGPMFMPAGSYFVSGEKTYHTLIDTHIVGRCTCVQVPEGITKKWFEALREVYIQYISIYGDVQSQEGEMAPPEVEDVYMNSDSEM